MEIKNITHFLPEYVIPVQSLLDQLTTEKQMISASYLKEIIESDNSYFFLLFIEENIAGMLTIGIYKSPSGTKAWIEDVAVDEAYREQGLGKELMLHALSFAKSSGYEFLMLTSNPSRIAANKLYQSLGFAQKVTNVYKMKL